MKRAAFAALAAAAPFALRARAAAQPSLDLDAVVERIPGIAGVYVRTLGDGPPLYTARDGEPFAAASVIKLIILAHVYRAYDAGTARPTDKVRVRAGDLIGGSDVLAGTSPGTPWSLDALVRAMIRYSDNSASNTLITTFGMDAINATARAAGMTGTRLARHFADVVPPWRRSQNVTTPRDVGTLLATIERGAREGSATIASVPACRAMLEVLLTNADPSKIVRGLPPGTPCAHKTGEIDGVRNDAGVVDPFGDTPYVLVVLTRELRSTAAGDAGIAAIARRVDASLRA